MTPNGTVPVGAFVPWNPAKPNGCGWIMAESGCHLWTGTRNAKGYGRVYVGCRTACFVHRVRYEREVGPIPEGMCLDHYACDNGPGGCCNPHHCRPATIRENVLRGNGVTAKNAAKTHCRRGHPLSGDNLSSHRLLRGERQCWTCRGRCVRGEFHPRAKLSEADVPEIRRLCASGMSTRRVAGRYGVSSATISDVAKRRTWRHVA